MSGRLIKGTLLVCTVMLLSAATFIVSTGTNSAETLSTQTYISPLAEKEPVPLPPPYDEFVKFVEHELYSTGTVGAAFTIVHRGRIIYTGTYGEREKGSGEKVDEHTLFRLASVSKGFAGVLAGLLEQEGVFSLDDKVADLYPGFLLKDSASTADLTIRNLLSHTSGLVPYAFDNLVEANEDLNTIIDHLDEVDISAPPGELYGYQNVMFSMIDPIASRKTGLPYPVLLQEKIFKPLGMTDASAGPVDIAQNPNLAYPHVKTAKGYLELHAHEGYYNVMPAAGVNASISDMGQWLLAMLGYRKDYLPDIVINNITTPVIYTPLKWQYTRYWKPFRERYYSLGWRIYQYHGRKIIYHGGYIRGYRAEIAFCPAEEVGIAFMQNSPNNLASRFVPTFLDLILPPIQR